jgi:hypothetical protein
MPYDFNIDVKQDHIRVEVIGHRSKGKEFEDAVRVWSQEADVCREKEINRVLAISKVTGQLPTIAAYDIAEPPGSFGWSQRFKFAYVDLNEESRNENVFSETVAINRGYNVKLFDNEQDAKEWLLG